MIEHIFVKRAIERIKGWSIMKEQIGTDLLNDQDIQDSSLFKKK